MEWKIELKEDNKLLGTLTCYEIDQPWHFCLFEPTDNFIQVKYLFDKLNDENEGSNSFFEIEEALQNCGLKLVSLGEMFYDSKEYITEFLLFIENKQARFRY